MRILKDAPVSARTRYGRSMASLLERMPLCVRGMRCIVDVIPRKRRWETVRRLIASAKRQGVKDEKIACISPGRVYRGRNPTYQKYRMDPDDKIGIAHAGFIVVDAADYFYEDQYKTWLAMTVPIVFLFDDADRAFQFSRKFKISRCLRWC